jgi:hypothetical protein
MRRCQVGLSHLITQSLSLDTKDQRPTFDRIEERMRPTYFSLPTMSRCERFFIE